jgi:uncharacterized membrane protein YoaT (DUF817 family)
VSSLFVPVPRSGVALRHLAAFAREQALSCVFALGIFAALALSRTVSLPFVPRYDLLLVLCLGLQWLMVRTGLETTDELKVIAMFHLLGLGLEIHKTGVGAWAYPEDGWLKVAGVPLYSGFMYASVGSYLCQAWRRLDLRLESPPALAVSFALGTAIYGSFFTDGRLPWLRPALVALVLLAFLRTRVGFALRGDRFRMPLPLSFVLIGLFVWLAENVATYLRAWEYPHQEAGWNPVHASKIVSWSLLVIVGFLLVAGLKAVKEGAACASRA